MILNSSSDDSLLCRDDAYDGALVQNVRYEARAQCDFFFRQERRRLRLPATRVPQSDVGASVRV